jgi:excisionase family DNA binding protein
MTSPTNTLETLQPGFIGVREAADLIGVNRYSLLDWIRDGKIPAYKIGNAFKIDRLVLAAWLEARRVG